MVGILFYIIIILCLEKLFNIECFLFFQAFVNMGYFDYFFNTPLMYVISTKSVIILEQSSLGSIFHKLWVYIFPTSSVIMLDWILEHRIEFLTDTFGMNSAVPVFGLSAIDTVMIDYACNDWLFMLSSLQGCMFDTISDDSSNLIGFWASPCFINLCDYRLLLGMDNHDFIVKTGIFLNLFYYFTDYFWSTNIVYPSLYRLLNLHVSWVYSNSSLISLVKYYLTFYISVIISYIYIIINASYDIFMMYIYDLGYKMEPLYLPYLLHYIYWVIRSWFYSFWYLIYIFLFFYSFYFYQLCYNDIWLERLEYWWEYFDLRIWRFLERSYYSTYELNIYYSLNFNYSFRRRRKYSRFYIYIWKIRMELKTYFQNWRNLRKEKKLPLAFEWYSSIHFKRRWLNHRRLNRMYIAFIWRWFFFSLWFGFIFIGRFCFSLFIRYAGILNFIHFYLYGISYAILWCWWIFTHEFCYNYEFL